MLIRVALLLLALAAGCSPPQITEPVPEQPTDQIPTSTPASTPTSAITQVSVTATPEAAEVQGAVSFMALTYQRLDGNRLVVGSGGLPAEPLDILLPGKPLWVVAASLGSGSIWVAALDNGEVMAYQIEGGVVSELELNLPSLPPGMPPALQVDGNHLELLPPAPDASPTTHPIWLEDGALAYIDVLGRLRLTRQEVTYTLAVDALPDARILSDGNGRLLFLSSPTNGYPHGVLGDDLEATAITLVDARTEPRLIREIQVEPGDVIEGIAPIWTDLDGDGEREIIVTQSSVGTGARIVVYRQDGGQFASGEPIGQGFRWRHQLAVGQFIAGGPQEIAVNLTPHIGGVVEIHSLQGNRLEIQAALSGYSSHQIYSRNLDSALAGDFNGDGRLEIALPDQSQTTLAGIQMVGSALQVVWEVPLGERLTTNLAAVILPDGKLALGAGQESNTLRIWLP